MLVLMSGALFAPDTHQVNLAGDITRHGSLPAYESRDSTA